MFLACGPKQMLWTCSCKAFILFVCFFLMWIVLFCILQYKSSKSSSAFPFRCSVQWWATVNSASPSLYSSLFLQRVWKTILILFLFVFVSLLSGTPGQWLSVEPAALTWAGSSRPPRRTCLRFVSGVWPAPHCFPVSPLGWGRARKGRAGTARVSSACDSRATFPCIKRKTNKQTKKTTPQTSVYPPTLCGRKYFQQSSPRSPTRLVSPPAANPCY